MCGFLFDPLFVMQYLASYLVFNNHLAEEGRADCALAIMWLLVFCAVVLSLLIHCLLMLPLCVWFSV